MRAISPSRSKTLRRAGLALLILVSLPACGDAQSADRDSSALTEEAVLRHQEIAMDVLLGWSGLSVAGGAVMVGSAPSRIVRDAGIQAIAWGAVDAAIAIWAKSEIDRKRRTGINPQEELATFGKVLLINTLLDILYIGAGIALTASGKESLRGHGIGIIVQGSFLFLFDGINYLLAGS
jgi:hypothetical protein